MSKVFVVLSFAGGYSILEDIYDNPQAAQNHVKKMGDDFHYEEREVKSQYG